MAVWRRAADRGTGSSLQGDVLTSSVAVYPVEAYSYASRFALKEARSCFPPAAGFRVHKTQLIVEWGPDVVAYAYDFGALVFINVPEPTKDEILGAFSKLLPREPHAPLREDFLVEVRAGARVGVEVVFDRVVVPELDRNTFEVIATVLAQSVSIDYYDEDAQAILDKLAVACSEIAQRGRPFGRQRDLMRFAGAAMAFQAEIIGAIMLLDKPDLTWEDEHADRLHDKLRYHFEVPERFKALETKLLTIRETLHAMLEMGAERRMFLVEAVVLVLIAIEVVMGFVRVH